MKQNTLESTDDCIHNIIFPLGRKHVAYGANPVHFELLGVLIVKSLMRTVPMDGIGVEQYDEINKAFLVFFKIIAYWLQFGYNYEKRSMT